MASIAGLQLAMVAKLSTCYSSATSFEIGKIFRLDENALFSPFIVDSEILPLLFIV